MGSHFYNNQTTTLSLSLSISLSLYLFQSSCHPVATHLNLVKNLPAKNQPAKQLVKHQLANPVPYHANHVPYHVNHVLCHANHVNPVKLKKRLLVTNGKLINVPYHAKNVLLSIKKSHLSNTNVAPKKSQ